MSNTIEINETNFGPEVLQSPLPVVVDFWAPWCGPCKMLSPLLDEIAGEQAGRVKVVKVNIEDNQGLAQRYSIQAVPTLLFFAKGEVQGSVLGAVGKKTILAKLAELSQAVQAR